MPTGQLECPRAIEIDAAGAARMLPAIRIDADGAARMLPGDRDRCRGGSSTALSWRDRCSEGCGRGSLVEIDARRAARLLVFVCCLTYGDPQRAFFALVTFFVDPTQRSAGVVDEEDVRRKSIPSFPSNPNLDALIAQGATQAFESILDEIVVVPAEALLAINLDVPRAARQGLVVAERLAPLWPELSTMSPLDFAKARKLPICALALLHAHELAEVPDERTVPLAMLLEEAAPLRTDLLQTAEMLAHFGLVSRERVALIRHGHGHADTASDLQALGILLGEAWPRIKHKVAITREQVDRAIPLSAQLQRAIGVREANPDPLVDRTDPRHVRAQAFTLFVGSYDECRRGISHLRWHEGDTAEIVPSLYRGRGGRRRVEDVTEGVDGLVDAEGVNEPEDEPLPAPMPGTVAATAADAVVTG
jgi:hypothetical protein